MKFFRIAVIASLTAISGVAIAATDGTTGAQSSGSSDVTVTKQQIVRITGVDNIEFGALGFLTAAESVASAMCIYSSAGGYNVTASSTTGYALTSGDATTDVAYTATWNGANLVLDTALGGQAGNSTEIDCASDTDNSNATLAVTLDTASFNSAEAATYTGTLTLTIAPE